MNTVNIIFLTYVNRSGSTYLANLLSSSKDVLACPEADILVWELLENPNYNIESPDLLLEKLNREIFSNNKLRTWGLPGLDKEFCFEGARNIDVFVGILDFYRQLVKPSASVILFKSERLVFLFRKICRLQVEGFSFKGIWIVRDPRAVYYSQLNTLFPESGKPMATNPVYAGMFWNRHTKAGNRIQKDIIVLKVKYEELVQRFEKSIGSLAEFINISSSDLDPAKGDLPGRLPPNHGEIHPVLSRGPVLEKVYEWKEGLDSKEIALVEMVTSRARIKLEYNSITGLGLKARLIPLAWYFALLFICKSIGNIIVFRLKRKAT